MAHTGFFVIADVAGYTQFLTQSELDHAQGVMEGLLQAVVDEVRLPLVVSNLQGDAILCYAPDEAVRQGQQILELIENLYCAFAATQELMERNTTCPCNACRNLVGLDLKVIAHHGEYAIQTVGGRRELGGPDVIVAHRLLKNDVTAGTGLTAYALVTEAAAEAMGLVAYFAARRRQRMHYDTGPVDAFVAPLRPVWEARRQARQLVVGLDEPLFIPPVVLELPVPPARAWAYLTDPSYVSRWMAGLTALTISRTDGGRLGLGTTYHCTHGKETFLRSVLAWQPFRLYTYECLLPLGMLLRGTEELEPAEGGTRAVMRWIVVLPTGPMRVLARAMLPMIRRPFRKMQEENARGLAALAAQEAAAEGPAPAGAPGGSDPGRPHRLPPTQQRQPAAPSGVGAGQVRSTSR
jgi:hypothetical protein